MTIIYTETVFQINVPAENNLCIRFILILKYYFQFKSAIIIVLGGRYF